MRSVPICRLLVPARRGAGPARWSAGGLPGRAGTLGRGPGSRRRGGLGRGPGRAPSSGTRYSTSWLPIRVRCVPPGRGGPWAGQVTMSRTGGLLRIRIPFPFLNRYFTAPPGPRSPAGLMIASIGSPPGRSGHRATKGTRNWPRGSGRRDESALARIARKLPAADTAARPPASGQGDLDRCRNGHTQRLAVARSMLPTRRTGLFA